MEQQSDRAARAAHRETGSFKGEQSIIREKDQAKQQGVQVSSRDRRPRISLLRFMCVATRRKRGGLLPAGRGGKQADLGSWVGWLLLWTELYPPQIHIFKPYPPV